VYFGLPKGNNDLNIINKSPLIGVELCNDIQMIRGVNILQHICKALNKNTLQIEE
jgi:hypothetical protein